jgi:hypothetical protein
MAEGNVNFQTVTLTAGGVLALTGSPTGSGLYTVSKNAGASAPQTITSITGGSGGALITIRPAVAGDITLLNDDITFILQENQDWLPASVNDRLTLRDRDGDGLVWVEEISRGVF